MAKKFIPAGIEVKRHLDAFVHVGCISRVFKNVGIDPHRTKGKEHRVYSQDGKTYWLLFDVLCHGFLTEFNINGRYLRAVLERPSRNVYILDMRFPYKITDELKKGNLTGEETYRELIEHFTIKWWDGAEFSKLLHNNQVKFNDSIRYGNKTRHLIMKLAEQYEKPEFVADDPVQFPRRFGYKCSQEIVGFIAAWLAYGNRKAILSTCEKLCKEMERLTPYMYIKNMGWRKYIDSEEPLYRFFKEKDFADLCRALKEIYDNNEDMEEALSKNYTRTMGATDYLDALISLFPGVKGIPQDSKSACKRLNMFLRWMCRRNSPVDLGIWSFIPQSSLLIPLDTHVATVGRQLGLITGKGDSMNTVLELTTNCRNVYPLDPCKCDFALFGYGVNNKTKKES